VPPFPTLPRCAGAGPSPDRARGRRSAHAAECWLAIAGFRRKTRWTPLAPERPSGGSGRALAPRNCLHQPIAVVRHADPAGWPSSASACEMNPSRAPAAPPVVSEGHRHNCRMQAERRMFIRQRRREFLCIASAASQAKVRGLLGLRTPESAKIPVPSVSRQCRRSGVPLRTRFNAGRSSPCLFRIEPATCSVELTMCKRTVACLSSPRMAPGLPIGSAGSSTGRGTRRKSRIASGRRILVPHPRGRSELRAAFMQ